MRNSLRLLYQDVPHRAAGVYLVLAGTLASPYLLYQAYLLGGFVGLLWTTILMWLLSSVVVMDGNPRRMPKIVLSLPPDAGSFLRTCWWILLFYPLIILRTVYAVARSLSLVAAVWAYITRER
jgi:hypothetical protein